MPQTILSQPTKPHLARPCVCTCARLQANASNAFQDLVALSDPTYGLLYSLPSSTAVIM